MLYMFYTAVLRVLQTIRETDTCWMAAPRGNSRAVARTRGTRRRQEEGRSSLEQLLEEINRGRRADVTTIIRLLDRGDLGPPHELQDTVSETQTPGSIF